MIENERSRKHQDRINAMEDDSPLRDLPYGDSVVFPDGDRHFLTVGLGDRVAVRELCEYPISWDTKNMLAMAVAAVERLEDTPESLWKHRAQINCLLDLRVYLPMYRGPRLQYCSNTSRGFSSIRICQSKDLHSS